MNRPDNGRKEKETRRRREGSSYVGDAIIASWTYDPAGRLKRAYDARVPNPNDTAEAGRYYTEYAYDYAKNGEKISATAAVTLSGQTSSDNCHGITGAFCLTQRWVYDEVGNVKEEYLPRGGGASAVTELKITYVYNKVQRLTKKTVDAVTGGLNQVWTYGYNATGQKTSETDPLLHDTTWTHDEVGRVLSVADHSGNTSSSTYDRFGNRTSLKDPNLQGTSDKTTYWYDRANRLIKVTDPENNTAEFGYNKLGNRISLKDPKLNLQEAEYDRLGRLTKELAPASNVTGCTTRCSSTTSYAVDGLPTSTTDFNNHTTSYVYDDARRLKTVDYANANTPDVTTTYDRAGRRAVMSETTTGNPSTTYSYDELGRLLSSTRSVSGGSSQTVAYRYDLRDQVALVLPSVPDPTNYAGQKTLSYSYDAAGRLTAASDWRGSGGLTAYTYDAANRKDTRTLPTGAHTKRNYNNVNRLTSVEHRLNAGGTLFASYSYTYDAAGNRKTQVSTDANGTVNQTFTYDKAHRLDTEARTAGGTTTTYDYDYDAAGKRTFLKVNGSTQKSYTYDADNRLTSITGEATFGYDANGAIVSKTETNGPTTSYTYDGARRLSEVQVAGVATTSFQYDGGGARVQKTHTPSGQNAVVTTYANDTRGLSQVLQATTGSNTLTFTNGTAQFDPSQSGVAQWAYFHGDAQNNRVLTDGSKAVTKTWDFDPFGGVRAAPGSGSSEFGYAGEQRDGETGLINLRARYYDPSLGRFLSRDVLSGQAGYPQTMNRYVYGLNNPLRFVDPSGYCSQGTSTGNDPDCQRDEEDPYWDDGESDGDDGDDGVDGADTADLAEQLAAMFESNSTWNLEVDQGLCAAGASWDWKDCQPIGMAFGSTEMQHYHDRAGGDVTLVYISAPIDGASANPEYAFATAPDLEPYDPANFPRDAALIIVGGVGVVGILVGGEAVILAAAGGSAVNVQHLVQRAQQISNVIGQPFQHHRTTAVLETVDADGQTQYVIAGGTRNLDRAQRNLLDLARKTSANRPTNAHAEVKAVETAERMGWNARAIGTSNRICSVCRDYLTSKGADINSEYSAVWRWRDNVLKRFLFKQLFVYRCSD